MWPPSELEPERLAKTFPNVAYYARIDPEEWAAVHPILGEAFMATVAAAAARDVGLEVVTDSSYVHAVASCRDEETIYQMLIHGRQRTGASDPATTLRLAHLVIVGGFDVSNVTANDLVKMSKNREALFDFRCYLAERVAQIPEMDSEVKREAHLKAAAAEALDEWRKRLANMSRFAKRFFGIRLIAGAIRLRDDRNAPLLSRFLRGTRRGRQLQHGRALTFARVTSHHRSATFCASNAESPSAGDVLNCAGGFNEKLESWQQSNRQEKRGPKRPSRPRQHGNLG
jgi:hypothetical protein